MNETFDVVLLAAVLVVCAVIFGSVGLPKWRAWRRDSIAKNAKSTKAED